MKITGLQPAGSDGPRKPSTSTGNSSQTDSQPSDVEEFDTNDSTLDESTLDEGEQEAFQKFKEKNDTEAAHVFTPMPGRSGIKTPAQLKEEYLAIKAADRRSIEEKTLNAAKLMSQMVALDQAAAAVAKKPTFPKKSLGLAPPIFPIIHSKCSSTNVVNVMHSNMHISISIITISTNVTNVMHPLTQT